MRPYLPFTIGAVLVLGAALTAVPRAGAADKEGRFAAKGAGLQTCARLMEEQKKKSNVYFFFGGWIEGFVSAVNRYEADTYDVAPWMTTELLMALVTRHCRTNPNDRFINVVQSMTTFLRPARLKEPSPAVTVKVGETSMRIYEEVLRQVQRRLKDFGFYKAVADGQFGPRTQAALEEFQNAAKLKVTGLPDQNTLAALFIRKRPDDESQQPQSKE